MTKPFHNTTEDDRKETRPEGAGNADEPLKQTQPFTEVTHMPFEHDIGDSAPKNNPEPATNWKSIAELARQLAEKAAGK